MELYVLYYMSYIILYVLNMSMSPVAVHIQRGLFFNVSVPRSRAPTQHSLTELIAGGAQTRAGLIL